MGRSVAGTASAPMIFTMGHELKHHLVDRDSIVALCDPSNQSGEIEIGAEIFAAEMIYAENMLRDDLSRIGVKMGSCTAEQLVILKHETKATLSYAGIAKRAEFLGIASQNSLAKIVEKAGREHLRSAILQAKTCRENAQFLIDAQLPTRSPYLAVYV
jgi:Zn-dependent peptidase ImmA (M78 family)